MEPDASERIAAKINRKGEIMTQIELFLLLALLFAGAGCLLSLFTGLYGPTAQGLADAVELASPALSR